MVFKHVPRLLKLAGPMILSTSAITFMQIIDAVVLSRHSSEAVAAIGPSGLAVILFTTASVPLMSIFAGAGPESVRIVETGTLLMKFVAFYCMFDAANIMIGCVLASAGDTRWIARTFFACTGVFLVLLWLVDRIIPGLVSEWSLATIFVFFTAVTWSVRFRFGAWRKVRVLREPL